MVPIAASTVSEHASAAAREVASHGGNAVDATVAASIIGMVSEPGVVSLGGGGFLTIWPPDAQPVTIDGYAAMPGKGQDEARFGGGVFDAWMGYGGGMTTTVGHGSVAVPGALAACERAVDMYGSLPWANVVAPAIDLAHRGFPMSMAAYRYLTHCHETVFGWHPPSYKALHKADGSLLLPGETVHISDLAETLETIASAGAGAFYRGILAERIIDDMDAGGGLLTLEDLATYEVEVRRPLQLATGEWSIATNPPPAVGGTTLSALLLLMSGEPRGSWTREALSRLVSAQRAVFEYRRDRLDESEDLSIEAASLLKAIGDLGPEWATRSPSTIHTSVVDAEGLACAATFSAGYGSGVMAPGTGIWLNNSLGEIELNPRGPHARKPRDAPAVEHGSDGCSHGLRRRGCNRLTGSGSHHHGHPPDAPQFRESRNVARRCRRISAPPRRVRSGCAAGRIRTRCGSGTHRPGDEAVRSSRHVLRGCGCGSTPRRWSPRGRCRSAPIRTRAGDRVNFHFCVSPGPGLLTWGVP